MVAGVQVERITPGYAYITILPFCAAFFFLSGRLIPMALRRIFILVAISSASLNISLISLNIDKPTSIILSVMTIASLIAFFISSAYALYYTFSRNQE